MTLRPAQAGGSWALAGLEHAVPVGCWRVKEEPQGDPPAVALKRSWWDTMGS